MSATISDTIRRAALGPTPAHRHLITGWLQPDMASALVFNYLLEIGVSAANEFRFAPERVQRMFLCFVAESCE